MLHHPFEPIVFDETHTLILGTFPSIQSLKNAFYYAHPRNQFWTILSEITGYPVNNRDQKIRLLKENKLGLWDMIAACERQNSLDSSLVNERLNDIPALIKRYSSIRRLAFTGKKAQALFERAYGTLAIERIYLPSPSPAYAAMPLDEKIARYREVLGIKGDI